MSKETIVGVFSGPESSAEADRDTIVDIAESDGPLGAALKEIADSTSMDVRTLVESHYNTLNKEGRLRVMLAHSAFLSDTKNGEDGASKVPFVLRSLGLLH